MSGNQDEIVPRDQMVTLWNIAIGKMNPDGTPLNKPITAKARNSLASSSSSSSEPEENKAGGSEDARSRTVSAAPAEVDEGDPDTREYAEYETVDDRKVLLCKRTRYRVWREFENGTHSTSPFGDFYVTHRIASRGVRTGTDIWLLLR